MFMLALNSAHGHFHILGHIVRSALGSAKLLEVVEWLGCYARTFKFYQNSNGPFCSF